MHILEVVASRGGRPVYVSRGFGGVAERLDVVTVVPPSDEPERHVSSAGWRIVRRGAPKIASRIGDEGAMVARRLPGVPLVLCKDKRRAVHVAAELYSPTHVVLDDAFQSWGVWRDVDVVLIDAKRRWGIGWLLPAGDLRESPEALGRADVIGVVGVSGEADLNDAGDALASEGVRKPLFGVRRRIDITAAEGGAPHISTAGIRLAALSAIGRPEQFENQPTEFAVSYRYPDHFAYTQGDADWIMDDVARRSVDTVVTTEKDWAKLRDLDIDHNRFAVARLTLEMFGAEIPV
jgi:tetraacyldisaccharide 4'-kinase